MTAQALASRYVEKARDAKGRVAAAFHYGIACGLDSGQDAIAHVRAYRGSALASFAEGVRAGVEIAAALNA